MNEFFTVVFRGDIRKLGFNPFTAETIYGEPVGVSVGDCLTDLWELQDRSNGLDVSPDCAATEE